MNKYFQNNELNLNVEKNDLCYIASGCGTDVRKKTLHLSPGQTL